MFYEEISTKQDLSYIQSYRNGSNTDGSFTMAYSNSFLSPYEILQIAKKTTTNIKGNFLILL